MPVVLYRIDERLIHGQVVMGWGPQLAVEHYVVVDDELATSEWEQDRRDAGSGPRLTPCKRKAQNQIQTSVNPLVGTGRKTAGCPLQLAQQKEDRRPESGRPPT